MSKSEKKKKLIGLHREMEATHREMEATLKELFDECRPAAETKKDLLSITKDLQKRQKKRFGGDCQKGNREDASIGVTFMKCGKQPHVFTRHGLVVDVTASRSDTYSDIVRHACTVLNLEEKPGKVLSLFKLNGSLIPSTEGWTLESYLRHCHSSPDKTKIGVGYVPIEHLSVLGGSSSSEGERTPRPTDSGVRSQSTSRPSGNGGPSHVVTFLPSDGDIRVKYSKYTADKGYIFGKEFSLWQVGRDIGVTDDPVVPEDHGFRVIRVTMGERDLLYPADKHEPEYISVADASGPFRVVYQSSEVVTVGSFLKPVQLICIASYHDNTVYNWEVVGKQIPFPSSPVIYVFHPGMYQCRITNYVKGHVTSQAIQVQLEPDTDSSEDDFDLRPKKSKHHQTVKQNVKQNVKQKKKEGRVTRRTMAVDIPSDSMEFTIKELEEGTNKFSKQNIIGQGGFGTVYRGTVRKCLDVAVKVLSKEGKVAFSRERPNIMMGTEMGALRRFTHPNIVLLCGYCMNPMSLVFEFLENGSVYDRLHKRSEDEVPLSWSQRVNIVTGACRGICYLHAASPILIHQDIKSANILLDRGFNAKIADFGFCVEKPQVSSGRTMFESSFIARSEGYYPPEITCGSFSDRSDVYCFGVVILEIFTGLKVYEPSRADQKLMDHLQEELTSEEKFKHVSDGLLPPPDDTLVATFFKVIKEATKSHSRRPSSAQILSMLEE